MSLVNSLELAINKLLLFVIRTYYVCVIMSSYILCMYVRRSRFTQKVKCECLAHCFLRLQWCGALWIEVRCRLRVAICQKRIELWKNRCLCVRFGPKRKDHNHASTNVFTGLFPRWLFPLHKIEYSDERKALCYDWGDKGKSQWKLLAIPERVFQKCSENWKKHWHKCIIYKGGYFEGGQFSYWSINKYFLKKLKITLIFWSFFDSYV